VACREAGVSQQSYYRWRKEYGGPEIDQAKRMNDLERENVRLKRLIVGLEVCSRGPDFGLRAVAPQADRKLDLKSTIG